MIKKFLLLGLIFPLIMLMIGCDTTPTPTTIAELMVQSIDFFDYVCYEVGYDVFCFFVVKFTIANVGLGNAGPFKVLVKIEPALEEPQTISVSGLASYAEKTLLASRLCEHCFAECTFSVEITVDSAHDVHEFNEENNIYSENFFIFSPGE